VESSNITGNILGMLPVTFEDTTRILRGVQP
jgi:hypothetical protein